MTNWKDSIRKEDETSPEYYEKVQKMLKYFIDKPFDGNEHLFEEMVDLHMQLTDFIKSMQFQRRRA